MKFKQFLLQYWWIFAFFATFAFFIITFVIGLQQNIWFDESYSIKLAQSSWRDLFSLTIVDAHPPLFYAILKIWGILFGFDEFALRILPELFMSATIFLMILLTRKIFGSKIALLSAPIFVLSPMLLRYGFEIRMYSLAALIAIGSTCVLLKLTEKNSRKLWIIYGILVALGMLTLNYMIFVFAAHFIWLIVKFFRAETRPKILRENWLKSYILAVILYLPWLPFAVSQLTNDVSSGVVESFGPLQIIKILSFSLVYQPDFWLSKFANIAIILIPIIVVFGCVKMWQKLRKQRDEILLILMIFIVPLILMMFLSLFINVFLERYIVHFIFSGYILLGASVSYLIINSKNLHQKILSTICYILILATLLIGVFSLDNFGNYNFQRMQKNSAQEIVESFGKCQPNSTIVIDDIYEYFAISYYMKECDSLYFFTPNEIEYNGGFAPLSHDKNQLNNQKISTPNLIVVRTKDELNDENYRVPNNYRLVKIDASFEKFEIKYYAQDLP